MWVLAFDWVPLESLTLKSCPRWASSNSLITAQIFLPQHWLLRWFPPVFVLVSHDSLHLPLSSFGSNSVPCVLPSFMNPRRLIAFLVCSAYLLEWDGDFQAPYMQKWKQKSPPQDNYMPTIIIPYWFSFWIELYSRYSLGLASVAQHGL